MVKFLNLYYNKKTVTTFSKKSYLNGLFFKIKRITKSSTETVKTVKTLVNSEGTAS
jgi:hypothetical protein